ncbi:Stringent starvation protein A [bacterium YEK0313]|nr:Stringent starvation protein A [bacterium YEK0313]
MSRFTLYNAPQSTCSQRVRFVLNAKGLPFAEEKLDLFSGDQLQPAYLRINPNGVVPTLVDNGTPIVDSAVIIEYLDEVFAEPCRFTPAAPLKRAEMRSLMRFIDDVPTPAVRVPSYNLAFLRHFRGMSEEEFLALANSKPLRKEFLLKMGRTGFPKEEMDAALARLARGLQRMDETIAASGGPWLMGADITLADVAVMPVLVRLADINLAAMWQDKPRIAAWFDAIRAHPAYAPTYYHGSLLTEKYPELKQELGA